MAYAPGRPMKLASKTTIPDGDGTMLVMTIREAIAREIEATGCRPTQCGELVGVPRESISRWLSEANRLAEKAARLPEDFPWTRRERLLLNSLHDWRAAKSKWIRERLLLHNQIARGGLVVGEITEKVDATQLQRDADGGIVYGDDGRPQPLVLERSVKRKRLIPDARAIEWELERLAREDFAQRVEVTGADGGPIETEDVTARREKQAESLNAEIDAYLRGVADGDRQPPRSAPPEEGQRSIAERASRLAHDLDGD